MPIIDLQRRYREIGRIRAGDRGEKGAPRKLDCFRLTSPSRDLLDAAASVLGGTTQPWQDAPAPDQWELYTTSDRLPVVVPPGQTLSQWYELWSAGGCQRRCDGRTEVLSDSPCLCAENDPEERACRITTRLSVMLPDVPDIGVWRLESHGYYAATELAGTWAILERATQQGVLLPAQLRLEQRIVKRSGTLRYVVPVLELPETTPRTLLAGTGALEASATPPDVVTPALAAPPPAPPAQFLLEALLHDLESAGSIAELDAMVLNLHNEAASRGISRGEANRIAGAIGEQRRLLQALEAEGEEEPL